MDKNYAIKAVQRFGEALSDLGVTAQSLFLRLFCTGNTAGGERYRCRGNLRCLWGDAALGPY